MRLLPLAVLASVLALPALAQDARIRSGEHDSFSRLVIYLPAAAEYRVERADRSFAIDFAGDFGFDASEVFYYIPRDRVADLAAGDGRLELDLACACDVTVERLSETAIYLDVNDPGTVEVTEEETPEPAATATVGAGAQGPFAPPIRLPAVAPRQAATLLPGGLAVTGGAVAENDHEPRAPQTAEAPAEPAASITSETTLAVAEQVARAAAQGLLDVEASAVPARPEQRPAAAVPAPAEAEPEIVEQGAGGTRSHVSIRSSIDEALGRRLSPALGDLGMTGPCLPDETFDAAAWEPAPGAGLASLRADVVGEFDRAEPEGVAALARAYISLTFGAEAQHAIRSFRVKVPDADILLAMADIVDEGQARHPGRLATQYDCPGAGALWAALAAPAIPDAAELDTDAVALAFSALPAHLRTRLGPILAERLLDYGATETASVVRTAIMRAPGTPTVETDLLDASLALKRGHGDEADAKLAEVVEETSGRSVEAVERLIERRIAAGEPVEDEVLAAADALIFEHRGTPLAYRLSELRIEGLASSGRARHALAFLAETERHLPPETVDRLRGVIYAEAARQLDDPEFLLVAVRAPSELGHAPEEMAARRALARRLAEMELFELAASLGVEDGQPVRAASHATAPAVPPDLREPMPVGSATLERTAALIEHSAALRQRLGAMLGGEAAAPQ